MRSANAPIWLPIQGPSTRARRSTASSRGRCAIVGSWICDGGLEGGDDESDDGGDGEDGQRHGDEEKQRAPARARAGVAGLARISRRLRRRRGVGRRWRRRRRSTVASGGRSSAPCRAGAPASTTADGRGRHADRACVGELRVARTAAVGCGRAVEELRLAAGRSHLRSHRCRSDGSQRSPSPWSEHALAPETATTPTTSRPTTMNVVGRSLRSPLRDDLGAFHGPLIARKLSVWQGQIDTRACSRPFGASLPWPRRPSEKSETYCAALATEKTSDR